MGAIETGLSKLRPVSESLFQNTPHKPRMSIDKAFDVHRFFSFEFYLVEKKHTRSALYTYSSSKSRDFSELELFDFW